MKRDSKKKLKRELTALKKDKTAENKIRDVMHEFKEGSLHSGSKMGPKVKRKKQALAIALSESARSRRKK